MESFNKNRCYRFTLVEILVVCALLAFLMALSVVGYGIATKKAAEASTISIIEQIKSAMAAYKSKTGYYIQQPDAGKLKIDTPSSGVDFTDFLPDYDKWKSDGTIDENNNLVDAYGMAFWYRCPGYHNRGGFDIESSGADSIFGYYEFSDQRDVDTAIDVNKTHKPNSTSHPELIADNIKNWK